MAQIQGLEEQKEALKRINSNLKAIEDVNAVIRGIMSLAKDETLSVSYDMTISFNSENDLKKFKCPIMFDNSQVVIDAVQKYKGSLVDKVREDSVKHRISLTPEEDSLLEQVGSPE